MTFLEWADAAQVLEENQAEDKKAKRKETEPRAKPKKPEGKREEAAPPAKKETPTPPAEEPKPKKRRRSEEHTSELQSQFQLVCRLLLEKKKPLRALRTHSIKQKENELSREKM